MFTVALEVRYMAIGIICIEKMRTVTFQLLYMAKKAKDRKYTHSMTLGSCFHKRCIFPLLLQGMGYVRCASSMYTMVQ